MKQPSATSTLIGLTTSNKDNTAISWTKMLSANPPIPHPLPRNNTNADGETPNTDIESEKRSKKDSVVSQKKEEPLSETKPKDNRRDCWLETYDEYLGFNGRNLTDVSLCTDDVNSTLCTYYTTYKLFALVHATFIKYNITWFLHFGSGIGVVRHGGYIPHDYDMDGGVLIQNDEDDIRWYKAMNELKPKLKWISNSGGLKRQHGSWWRTWIGEVKPKYVATHLDMVKFTVNRTLNALTSDPGHNYELPLNLTFPLNTCRFYGFDLPCPRYPAMLIAKHYNFHGTADMREHKKENNLYAMKSMKCLEERGYPNALFCKNKETCLLTDHYRPWKRTVSPVPEYDDDSKCCLWMNRTLNEPLKGIGGNRPQWCQSCLKWAGD